MFASFKRLLDGAPEAPPADHPDDERRAAVAGLLVEAARMDGTLDEDERERIAHLLAWRFEVPEADALRLVQDAETAVDNAVDWLRFTQAVIRNYVPEERVVLIEMLWDVAYADGEVHDHEAALVRRLAGLLHVPDRDSGAARQRARARWGAAEG